MKVFFRRIHLYLSLAAGLVILSCCFTGAVLVFQKELEQSFYKDRYFVEPLGEKLSLDSLAANVKRSYPGGKINSLKVYTDSGRSVEIAVLMQDRKKDGNKQTSVNIKVKKAEQRPEQRQPTLTAFVNPYTGKVLELYNPRKGFFYTMLSLHRWLLGSNNGIGKYITGVSTFIFLFIIITGIILWWPKTKNILKQRLKIKWAGGWKRLNHDLHMVLGFYSAIFLFVFAFTALAWSFEWFNAGIYKITNSPIKPPAPPTSVFASNLQPIGFDQAFATAKASTGEVAYYTIAMPKDSSAAITITSLGRHAAHETATDVIYLDQYSGKLLGQQLFEDRSTGARVRSTFRPVHVGSIWGVPSKVIAFIVCLLGVSFPVTGSIMWFNRTRKNKRNMPAA